MAATVADDGRPVAPAIEWPVEAPRSKWSARTALAFKALATAGALTVVASFFADLDAGAAWGQLALRRAKTSDARGVVRAEFLKP